MWQSLKDHLVKRLEDIRNEGEGLSNVVKDDTVNIKVSGDGTRFGKRIHVMNFTYT